MKLLFITALMFLCSCKTIHDRRWNLINAENPLKFQADADSILARTPADVNRGKTGPVERDGNPAQVDIKTVCRKVRFHRPWIPFTNIQRRYVVTDGCNEFTGSYRDDGDSLRLSAGTGTRLPCPSNDADAVVNAYFYSTDRVSFRGEDTLVLHNPLNNALIFKADEVYY